jgi:hypothetical protein
MKGYTNLLENYCTSMSYYQSFSGDISSPSLSLTLPKRGLRMKASADGARRGGGLTDLYICAVRFLTGEW